MLIYDDRSVTVTTIPLKHRIPCCGFLFSKKKQRPNHIIRDMVDFYKVPVYELNRIKNGADFVTPEGEVIPNLRLTRLRLRRVNMLIVPIQSIVRPLLNKLKL